MEIVPERPTPYGRLLYEYERALSDIDSGMQDISSLFTRFNQDITELRTKIEAKDEEAERLMTEAQRDFEENATPQQKEAFAELYLQIKGTLTKYDEDAVSEMSRELMKPMMEKINAANTRIEEINQKIEHFVPPAIEDFLIPEGGGRFTFVPDAFAHQYIPSLFPNTHRSLDPASLAEMFSSILPHSSEPDSKSIESIVESLEEQRSTLFQMFEDARLDNAMRIIQGSNPEFGVIENFAPFRQLMEENEQLYQEILDDSTDDEIRQMVAELEEISEYFNDPITSLKDLNNELRDVTEEYITQSIKDQKVKFLISALKSQENDIVPPYIQVIDEYDQCVKEALELMKSPETLNGPNSVFTIRNITGKIRSFKAEMDRQADLIKNANNDLVLEKTPALHKVDPRPSDIKESLEEIDRLSTMISTAIDKRTEETAKWRKTFNEAVSVLSSTHGIKDLAREAMSHSFDQQSEVDRLNKIIDLYKTLQTTIQQELNEAKVNIQQIEDELGDTEQETSNEPASMSFYTQFADLNRMLSCSKCPRRAVVCCSDCGSIYCRDCASHQMEGDPSGCPLHGKRGCFIEIRE